MTIWIGPKKKRICQHFSLSPHQPSIYGDFFQHTPPQPEWAGAWHKPQDEFHKRRRGRWNRSQRPTTRKALRPPHHHPHLSNETKTWLFVKYIRDGKPTQLCRDLKKKPLQGSHHQLINQPVWRPHGIRRLANFWPWQQKMACYSNAGAVEPSEFFHFMSFFGWKLKLRGVFLWPNGHPPILPSSHPPTMKPPETVLPKRPRWVLHSNPRHP